MTIESVLWSVPVWSGDEKGSERSCLLLARAEEWTITVDDSVPLMCLKASLGSFPGEEGSGWLRLGPLNCLAEDARWIRLLSTDEADVLAISSLSMWNLLKINSRHGQLLPFAAHFAFLPGYMKNTNSPARPLSSTLRLSILADSSTEPLFFKGMTGRAAQTLLGSLRSIKEPCVLLEGDHIWIDLDFPKISVPLRVLSLPMESFFSFASIPGIVLSLDPVPSVKPPRPGFLVADLLPGSCRALALEISTRAFQEPTRGKVCRIFNISGPIHTAVSILRHVSGETGLPLLKLPLEDTSKINSDEIAACPVIWYLLVFRKNQEQAYAALCKISKLPVRRSNFIFVVTEAPLEGPKSALFYETFAIDRLSLADQVEILEGNNHGTTLSANLPIASREELISALAVSQVNSISVEESWKQVKRQARSGTSTEIPRVRWDQIAGLQEAKMRLKQFIQIPSHPGKLGRRCGLLMWGPPGTGKTLMAKAVATELSFTFLSIKGPEILDIYVGESEAHIREVFAEAKANQPCVLFFDELDSLAVARGRDGDAGGVTDRLVSQLLIEMDELLWNPDCSQIFLLGATNRPDLLDPALLRTGRFDQLVYLGLPKTSVEQADILMTTARGLDLDDGVDFTALAAILPKNLSPADLASINKTAQRIATAKAIRAFELAGEGVPMGTKIKISQNDLIEAASATRPSVSPVNPEVEVRQ